MMMALLSGSAFAADPRSAQQALAAFTNRDFCEAREFLNGERREHVPFAVTTLPNLLREEAFILNARGCMLNITVQSFQDYDSETRLSQVLALLTVSLVDPAQVDVRGELVEIPNAPLLTAVRVSAQLIEPDNEAEVETVEGQLAQVLRDAFEVFLSAWRVSR